MGPVASLITEVYFAMLDDRVVPVGDINCPVGAHFDIDRPKGDVPRLDQFRFLPRGECRGAIFGDHKAADPVGTKIIGDHVALEFIRQVSATNNFQATM